MIPFFKTRRLGFFNFGLLFIFLSLWIFSYMRPLLKSFDVEDYHLLFGKVSYAAIPSLFGGSDIPFFDKTFFQINGDDNSTFVLYASKEILDEMSERFSFAAANVNDIPLEILAARVGDRFIVKGMASADWILDPEVLSEDYQKRWCRMGEMVVGSLAIVGGVFCFLGLLRRKVT